MGYPAFAYLSDALHEGRFPLWDPYTNCGYPFHADPNLTIVGPIALFFAYVIPDAAFGFVLYWLAHWWLGGLGMIWLARHFGAKPLGGFLSAVAFSLSGFFISHAEHTTFIVVAGWLPWLFWFADKSVLSNNKGWALLGGVVLGLSCLGGYPGLVAFNGLAIALWLGLRFLSQGGVSGMEAVLFRERMVRILWTLGIIGVISIAVWSPVLHAFFAEGGSYSDRVTRPSPDEVNLGGLFPVSALFSLLYPYATIAGRAWMKSDISYTNAYTGILTIPLAFLWWWNERKNRQVWWVAVFIGFMFVLSFGGPAGLRPILNYVYPPLQYLRHNAPFRIYWMLPVALMAGLGISRLPEYSRNRVRIVFTIWALIAFFAAVALGLMLSSAGVLSADQAPFLFLPAAPVLFLLLIVLWTKAGGHNVPGNARIYIIPAMIILAATDMAGHVYTNSFTVWSREGATYLAESLRQRTTEVNGEPGGRLPPMAFGSYNVQQVIKRPVVRGYLAMNINGFDGILCKSRFVEVMRSPTRFWLSPGVETAADGDTALSSLSSTGAGDPVPVFVDRRTMALPAARVIPGKYGSVRVQSYAPEQVVLTAEVPFGNGAFLASTERFSAGWKVWIDGAPGKVEKVNLYFRGLYMEPGRHEVIWKYEPHLWTLLVLLSAFTMIAATIAGIILCRRAGGSASL